MTPGKNSSAGEMLLQHIQAIERLLEERSDINTMISARKAAAKSDGFDIAVINAMIKERAMSSADRAEWQALLDTYRAALGMLDGTPLGDFARKRIMGEDEDKPATTDAKVDPETGEIDEPVTSADEARQQGRDAAKAGASIVSNPWPFGDPRRAAWDEGYCQESGTDGMEVPPAWRRAKKPPKPGKGDGE